MIAWSAQDLLAGFGYRCIADLEVELLSQASRVCCSAPKLEKPNRVNLPYALKEKAVSEFTLIAIINCSFFITLCRHMRAFCYLWMDMTSWILFSCNLWFIIWIFEWPIWVFGSWSLHVFENFGFFVILPRYLVVSVLTFPSKDSTSSTLQKPQSTRFKIVIGFRISPKRDRVTRLRRLIE